MPSTEWPSQTSLWYKCPASQSSHHQLLCPFSCVAEGEKYTKDAHSPFHSTAFLGSSSPQTWLPGRPVSHRIINDMGTEMKCVTSGPWQLRNRGGFPTLPLSSGWMWTSRTRHTGSSMSKKAELRSPWVLDWLCGAEPLALSLTGRAHWTGVGTTGSFLSLSS